MENLKHVSQRQGRRDERRNREHSIRAYADWDPHRPRTARACRSTGASPPWPPACLRAPPLPMTYHWLTKTRREKGRGDVYVSGIKEKERTEPKRLRVTRTRDSET